MGTGSTEQTTFFTVTKALRDKRCESKDKITRAIIDGLRIDDPDHFTAVLMPSMHGPEVHWLHERGVAWRNMFAIERDRAVHKVLASRRYKTTPRPMSIQRAVDYIPFAPASLVYLDFFGQPNSSHLTALYKLFKLRIVDKGSVLLTTFGVNRGETFSCDLNRRLIAPTAGQAYIEAAHQRAGASRIRTLGNHSYQTAAEFHPANFILTETRL